MCHTLSLGFKRAGSGMFDLDLLTNKKFGIRDLQGDTSEILTTRRCPEGASLSYKQLASFGHIFLEPLL